MNLSTLQESFPMYAKDIKLNLSSIMQNNTLLNEQQFYGTLVATAMASKSTLLFQAISAIAKLKLSEDAYESAKGAAALMAMNNIYYRFTHLASNSEYAKMPANLRMNLIASVKIEKSDFELFSLAVSAIHGCGKCIDSHEKILQSHGISKEIIREAVRIASVIHAAALVIETES